jgi:hypothetical protein
MDWQKAFDRVNWSKLKQALKKNDSDCSQRRYIRKVYRDQNVRISRK